MRVEDSNFAALDDAIDEVRIALRDLATSIEKNALSPRVQIVLGLAQALITRQGPPKATQAAINEAIQLADQILALQNDQIARRIAKGSR